MNIEQKGSTRKKKNTDLPTWPSLSLPKTIATRTFRSSRIAKASKLLLDRSTNHMSVFNNTIQRRLACELRIKVGRVKSRDNTRFERWLHFFC